MSTKKVTEMSSKVQEDDFTDSGLISGPLSENDIQDLSGNIEQLKESTDSQLDSGYDLTISEDLSKFSRTEGQHKQETLDADAVQLDSGVVVTITEDLSHCTISSKEIRSKGDTTKSERTVPKSKNQDVLPLNILFQQDDEGDTQLHIASVHGCQKSVSTLIRVCPEKTLLDVPNDYGHTALHLSVMCGNAIVTRMLVRAGATIGVRDLAGETPLHIAASIGNVQCIQALAMPSNEQSQRKLSSFLNQKNYNGQTAVHLAASAGHLEALQTLVYYGADINAREGLCGWTPLHLAAARADVRTAQYIASRCAGVALDARDYAGRTARRLAKRNAASAIFDADTDSEESDSDTLYDSDQNMFEEVRRLRQISQTA